MLKVTINCNYNNFLTTISLHYLLKHAVEKIEWILGHSNKPMLLLLKSSKPKTNKEFLLYKIITETYSFYTLVINVIEASVMLEKL